jgi:hypothetical protein
MLLPTNVSLHKFFDKVVLRQIFLGPALFAILIWLTFGGYGTESFIVTLLSLFLFFIIFIWSWAMAFALTGIAVWRVGWFFIRSWRREKPEVLFTSIIPIARWFLYVVVCVIFYFCFIDLKKAAGEEAMKIGFFVAKMCEKDGHCPVRPPGWDGPVMDFKKHGLSNCIGYERSSSKNAFNIQVCTLNMAGRIAFPRFKGECVEGKCSFGEDRNSYD